MHARIPKRAPSGACRARNVGEFVEPNRKDGRRPRPRQLNPVMSSPVLVADYGRNVTPVAIAKISREVAPSEAPYDALYRVMTAIIRMCRPRIAATLCSPVQASFRSVSGLRSRLSRRRLRAPTAAPSARRSNPAAARRPGRLAGSRLPCAWSASSPAQ